MFGRRLAAADRSRIAGLVEGADGQRVQSQPACERRQGIVGLDDVGSRLGQGADSGGGTLEGALAGHR